MKSMIIFALSLFASAAFAYPKVGDTATFNGTGQGSAGGSMDFTQTMALTAFDAASGTYTMEVSFSVQGQVQKSTEQVKADELLNSQDVANIMGACSAYGGQLEDLVVPMGTLKTCHLSQANNGQVWVADIAFGIAKQISYDQDGTMFTLEVASAVSGQ